MSQIKENKNNRAKKKTRKISAAAKNENGKSLKKTLADSLRPHFSSPAFNVAALVLLLVAVFGGLQLFSSSRNLAQLSFVESAEENAPENGNAKNAGYVAPEIFRGEVYSTAVRLRETGALGMAMSLVVLEESAERGSVPPNTEIIFNSIATRSLMPPGLQIENGEMQSASSRITVRYQAQPIRFEILSRPKDPKNPALLMRFPLSSLDGRTISYFQSLSPLARQTAPEPFAPLDRLVADGWTIEQWRGEMLPKDTNSAQILTAERQLLSELSQQRH